MIREGYQGRFLLLKFLVSVGGGMFAAEEAGDTVGCYLYYFVDFVRTGREEGDRP